MPIADAAVPAVNPKRHRKWSTIDRVRRLAGSGFRPRSASPRTGRVKFRRAGARTTEVVRAQHMADYPHIDPPVGRIGLTQVEYADQQDAYFDQVAEAEQRRQRLFSGLVDPLSVVFEQLRQAWDDDVEIATD